MTRQEFEAMLQALARGWREKDYETVAGWFAEDVLYRDPTRYSFTSRTELLETFFRGEEAEESTVWHDVVFDEERQLGAAEYTYQGTHRYHGTVWVQLRGNLIARWREYQHVSELEWKEFWEASSTAGAG